MTHSEKFSHGSEEFKFSSSVREALSTEELHGQSKNNCYVRAVRLAVDCYLGIFTLC